MKKNIKNQRGITLVSVIIIVVVLIILASIATVSGISTVRFAKYTVFKTELQILQNEVNSLKQGKTDEELLTYGTEMTGAQKNIFNINEVSEVLNGKEGDITTIKNDFRYFSKEYLTNDLSIDGITKDYYINLKERIIIATEPVKYENINYYMLEQIENAGYNVQYNNQTGDISFQVNGEYTSNGKGKITISDIVYTGYINKWEAQYRLQGEENWKSAGEFSGNSYTFEVTKTGTYEIRVIHNNEIQSELSVAEIIGKVNVADIFDETGKEEGKLHVGDFINYTAGDWTQEDINKITTSGAKIAANNSINLPANKFEFGGFTVGSSKDGNATPYDSNYNYVKDKETGEGITGWRVFDVDENGRMILISAGCPEDYYCSGGGTNGYITEYILSGNINSSATNLDLGLGTTYTPRDWSMYINPEYKNATATILTKTRLDEWYTKYITKETAANTLTPKTFQKIYKTSSDVVNEGMYESLVDNYSYYWLASAYNNDDISISYIFNVFTSGKCVLSMDYGALGLRVLVSLPANIQLREKSIGTKTVVSRDNEYTYNVWDLQKK